MIATFVIDQVRWVGRDRAQHDLVGHLHLAALCPILWGGKIAGGRPPGDDLDRLLRRGMPETPSSIFPSICHIVCSFAGGRRSTGMFFRRFPGAASIKFGGTGR